MIQKSNLEEKTYRKNRNDLYVYKNHQKSVTL